MFCTQCGAAAGNGGDFCTGCGHRVVNGSPEGEPSPRSPSPQRPLNGAVINHRQAITGLNIARALIMIVIAAFMVSKMNNLGMLDDIKGLSLFDTSETIHYRNNSDMVQLLQLRVSLPENTYARFDQAFSSIISVCAASEITKPSEEPVSCLTRNMDGKTVNQIIHLGSKLNDSDLSINQKLALVD